MSRWLLVLLAASGIACAAAAQVPADKIGALQNLVATKGQTQTSLGAPAFEGHSPDGRSTLMYVYPVPLTEKNKTIKSAAVAFVFDAHDVLTRKAVYGNSNDGPPDTQALASLSANALATPSSAGAEAGGGLEAENILLPYPAGFKVGSNHEQPHVQRMTEYLRNDETFDAWTRLITVNILYTQHGVDPARLPAAIAPKWSASCPGGTAEETAKSTVNGYPATLWLFQCPLNPTTQKPETMWMKAIGGADALYAVQYAFRSPISDATRTEAMTYLTGLNACDTRSAAHPCPDLKRVR